MLKRIIIAVSGTLLSLVPLLAVVPTVHAVAQTCQWIGTMSGDGKFNTSANWSGCGGGVPLAGDNLAFNNTTPNLELGPNNDMVGASFGLITFQGTNLYGFSLTGNAFSLAGGITEASNALDLINNDIAMTANQTISIPLSDTGIYLNGVISGSGNIIKTGNGALGLMGNNSSYTGSVTANGGNLFVGNTNALGTASAPGAIINDGADFEVVGCNDFSFAGNLTLTGNSSIIIGDFPNPKLGSLVGGCTGGGSADEEYGAYVTTNTVNLNGAIVLGSDITFAGITGTTNIKGNLSGSHKITMLPGYSGKLVISSTSNTSSTVNGTYNSSAFVKTLSDDQSAHTVIIGTNNIITIDGKRGTTVVNSGGKLMGTGTVGALTLRNGATVAPGHSPGCLSSGNVVFISGSSYDFEVGGPAACTEYDQIKVTGTVDLGNSTLNTILYNGFKPVTGQSYIIISNDGSDAVTGTFNNLAEGATFTVGGYVLKVTYKGGDGNDVVLSVQSVPTTPNTGFSLVTTYPLQAFLAITCIAGSIALIARRYNRLLTR